MGIFQGDNRVWRHLYGYMTLLSLGVTRHSAASRHIIFFSSLPTLMNFSWVALKVYAKATWILAGL
jgi:hypothetical protein